MKRWLALTAFVAILGLAGPNRAQEKNGKVEPVKDDPKLPRVLLIGDSISIGYMGPTQKLLAGKANVHHNPGNAGPSNNGTKNIKEWLGTGKWDVIHFNFGLHDIAIFGQKDIALAQGKQQVPIDKYEKNLRDLVKTLKGTGARLIWASTTPVPAPGKASKNEDAIAYNAIAKKIMDEHGITINDLYAFALPQLEKLQQPGNVHFNAKGSDALAERVATAIEAALKK